MSDKVLVKKKLKDFYKKGEVIFREGDIGHEMYIIKRGKVEVVKKTKKGDVVLATLEPKSFFGEMALFGDPHRSATIKAAIDTQMLVINEEILDSQLEKVPEWFVSMLRTLIERLRETNKRIKSRYKIGLEFSILKTVYFLSKYLNNSSDGDMPISYKKVCEECCKILSLSESDFLEKMKSLMFVGMVKFNETRDIFIIPNEEKLKGFMAFLRNINTENEKGDDDLAILSEDESNVAFERIYKLLCKKKL